MPPSEVGTTHLPQLPSSISRRDRLRSLRAVLARYLGLILFALLLFGVILYPSAVLLFNSFQDKQGRPTLALYSEVFSDAANYAATLNSLTVAGLGTLLGTLLGFGLAWLVARSDLPGRKFFRVVLGLPYLVPPFIGALAWVYLLGPVGFFTKLLVGPDSPPFRIYGFWGVLLVMVLYGYPVPYITTLAGLEGVDASQEEAARTSGAKPWQVFRDVTLPALGPSLGAGASLLFISLISNFGIPQVMGFPARYFVLTTRIYATVLNSSRGDNLQAAAALAIVLAVLVGVVTGLAGRLQRAGMSRAQRRTTGRGATRPAQPVRLGVWRWPLLGLVGLFGLVSTVAPLLAILVTSLTPVYGRPVNWSNLSLNNFNRLLNLEIAQRALLNSVALATGVALVIILLTSVLAYLQARSQLPGTGLLTFLVGLPYIVPGTVVGLAFILAFLRPLPVVNFSLYNTIWIIFVSYLARFSLLGLRTAQAAMSNLAQELEEAGRSAGAGPLRTFRDIVFPLLRPASLATAFLVFAPALSEATLSPLLISSGHETLGALALGLNDEGQVLLVAALAVLIVLLVLLVQGVAGLITRRARISGSREGLQG